MPSSHLDDKTLVICDNNSVFDDWERSSSGVKLRSSYFRRAVIGWLVGWYDG